MKFFVIILFVMTIFFIILFGPHSHLDQKRTQF